MANDLCLRSHPSYKHLFDDSPKEPVPEIEWMKAHQGLCNSKCGRYQVRKAGEPPSYSLYNVRIVPFARLIRDGFNSFDEVREFLRKG